MENPDFKKHQSYEPCRLFKNKNYTNREYNESWTGDWWWDTQARLPEGATVTPVILSSDKTQLTQFSGDKQAWPVYLGIANNSKEIRRKPSKRAMVLVGYIPVSKLDCFSAGQRSIEGYQLFHECMRTLVKPLVEAGKSGIDMVCADGFIRTVFPILVVYIADYPEQCLVACCQENSCPICTVDPKKRGDFRMCSVLHDPDKTLDAIDSEAEGIHSDYFKVNKLRLVDPFWRDLPHCNIFSCFTPDLLHQLHKGVFQDHLVSWATQAVSGGEAEVDDCFHMMALHPDLWHFKKGITLTSQWTGVEHKNMEKVFLGILAGRTDPQVILAVRGILDFIYYTHFGSHTDISLVQLDAAWLLFHENKDVFEDLEIRKHFNISKLHNIRHYIDSIRSHGTTDGFNTEGSERLHIDLAKAGYLASNKKDYILQMTTWLQRQESIHRFCGYLQWAVPGYTAASDNAQEADDIIPVDKQPDEGEDLVQKEDATVEAILSNERWAIVKVSTLPCVPVDSLATDYFVADFVLHLKNALQNIPQIPEALVSAAISAPTFPVYQRVVTVLSPILSISLEASRDTIHASRGSPRRITPQGNKNAVPPRYSTVLVKTLKGATSRSQNPLADLNVVQVRLIFTLPAPFSEVYSAPLAYISKTAMSLKPS
ncbi:hypothetical protein HYPSUDRAFT_146380 [Hypholoma sublateritium FD-334 SS-4]|uniref:CxC2-like cysteine cluster KDZ transposase-associated domain-containing protein n=1 Tax=Hypholoma sublateritium (strain FD-334 SS-4) TaxID=945553 RepID=A0A0D2PB58_HYPSF|nr:hypothetical protein HYPSUDRAFT_146380 [Hypholoma sublateritium FD-334 SS-4]